MKKLSLLVVLVTGLVTGAFAQAKKTLQTVVISTPSVQCDMCKKRIETFLAKEEGVTKSNVDYKKKKTTVTFYTDRTNIENIKTAIANVGYDADDVSANEESYEKLPKCCKKPE
ncbi:heavy-metal-associated domain-containing protein [Flavihumibacter petaseus]|uniref:Putative heavy metal-binding protein n=1 Tax=Flavihumibacter petaseus NBRC 106054 TaxID=1220578 RepID=A0A0E9N4T7_9BACT|nr:cation transporter [Flavihumibacter petaseus]GAO44360.1 putative heavy metal-binding protein [Flavihumibacter petaseus NBRC 106054]